MRRRALLVAGGSVVLSLALPRLAIAEGEAAVTKDLTAVYAFDAPIENVWQAWVDPELVKRWWGPAGFTCPVAKMDVRVGGVSLVCMRAPNGHDIYSTWAYTEVSEGEGFTYRFNLSDENGVTIDPASLGMPPDFPRNAKHTVMLKDLGGGRTELTMTEFGYTNDQQLELSKAGLIECLDKMAAIFAA